MPRQKWLIGWNEYIDLPDWGLHDFKVKIDTGARTSALHVEDIQRMPRRHVSFYVLIGYLKPTHRKRVTARVTREVKVRPTTGVHATRICVSTRMRLGPVMKTIEINLDDRSQMRYRMILGRTALRKDFLVDVSRSRLLSRRPGLTQRKTER